MLTVAKHVIGAFALIAGLYGSNTAVFTFPARAEDAVQPYKLMSDWGQLPDGREWGPTSGVAMDRDGMNVWALDRCGTGSCANSQLDPIVEFDSSGKAIKHFGAGLIVFTRANLEIVFFVYI